MTDASRSTASQMATPLTLRTVLHSKIHRARVTGADVDYVGSISIDEDLMSAADLMPHERVQVVDVNNGSRLETYAIPAPAGSGTIQLNGAAAHLVEVGDLVIIMAYSSMPEAAARAHRPPVVHVDEHNRPIELEHGVAGGPAAEHVRVSAA